MRNLKTKQCLLCGNEYQPTGSCSKFCSHACYLLFNKDRNAEHQKNYRRRQGRQVGVGSGGTTGSGKNNHMYKHGLGTCNNNRARLKLERRFCENCGKDLLDATHYQWVIHHIDHNKYNNPEDGSNWKLLCKKCHQIEHKCWNAFEGATTSLIRLSNGRFFNPNKRSSQEGSEMPDTQASVAAGKDIV